MTRYQLISALALSAAMAWPASAASDHAAITAAQIATAITDAGMKTSPEQVTLLSDVVATTGSPSLKVQSMEPWGAHRLRVRLDCSIREECLPFFVAVRSEYQTASQTPSAFTPPGNARPALKDSVLRAGSPATLLLEGGHVHIRLTVICLENGAAGQMIRVSSKDSKQTFKATVVDGAFLKAHL